MTAREKDLSLIVDVGVKIGPHLLAELDLEGLQFRRVAREVRRVGKVEIASRGRGGWLLRRGIVLNLIR